MPPIRPLVYCGGVGPDCIPYSEGGIALGPAPALFLRVPHPSFYFNFYSHNGYTRADVSPLVGDKVQQIVFGNNIEVT